MGLWKYLARKGAIGGTARLTAKQYMICKSIVLNQNDATDDSILGQKPSSEIIRLVIEKRYRHLSPKNWKEILLNKVEEINGVKELVIEILKVETRYSENTFKNILMFNQVIEEELYKSGLKSREIK